MEEERMRTVWLMQQISSRDGRGWSVMYSWPRSSGGMVENGSLTIYLAGVEALGKLNFGKTVASRYLVHHRRQGQYKTPLVLHCKKHLRGREALS